MIQLYDNRLLIGKQIPLTTSFQENLKRIQAFWISFHQEIRTYHLTQGSDFVKYGITFRKDKVLYYACCIPANNTYPNEFSMYQLPRKYYLVHTHTGSMATLPQTITYLMKEELVRQGLTPDQSQLIYYERYDARFAWNQATSIIEIGIPLVKAITLESISAKTILQGNGTCMDHGNWFGMQYNMNLYKGCPHGCIYCDSRSACYQVEHFDLVRVKQQELTILEMELKRKKRKGVVGIGAMSDTYHPQEANLEITRGALALLCRYGYGVGLATKSDLILRDLDLLHQISAQYASIVEITITCADDALAQIIEPHAPASSRRFHALQELHEAGVFAGVLCMPILPFINDTQENIKELVYQAHLHHAKFIYPGIGVTLRDQQRAYFYKQLDDYFPGKRSLYEQYYHNTYSCSSLQAKALYRLLATECERYGILYRMKDIVAAYQKKTVSQLSLLP